MSSWAIGTPGRGVGPGFRVYLHGGGAETTFGTSWTYDVTGADVQRLSPGHGRGLVWLVGMDGHGQSGSLLETPCRRRT